MLGGSWVKLLATIVRIRPLAMTRCAKPWTLIDMLSRYASRIDRRNFLIGSAGFTLVAAEGCSTNSEPVTVESSERRDVPLNILLVVSSDDFQNQIETIHRAWSALSEQPLKITPIQYRRENSQSLAADVVAISKRSDAVIYPISLASDLWVSEVITPLTEEMMAEMETTSGRLLLSLKNGAANYAGQAIGVPLGTSLPALLSSAQIEPVQSWEGYDQLVVESWNGKGAEPSAPGWAGIMFLWRAKSNEGWLFNRNNFDPLIDSDPYIESLQMFVTTHNRYTAKRQTPSSIWSGVVGGSLQGGIGWWHEAESGDEVHVASVPGASESRKVLLDPFSPVISLSANCRQTAATKRFISWISAGEGSSAMRSRVFGTGVVRAASASGTLLSSLAADSTAYNRWLADQLSNPIVLPTLQIRQATKYYAILDHHVGEALDGNATATNALRDVAKAWRGITNAVGVENQLQAWRRAQGRPS